MWLLDVTSYLLTGPHIQVGNLKAMEPWIKGSTFI